MHFMGIMCQKNMELLSTSVYCTSNLEPPCLGSHPAVHRQVMRCGVYENIHHIPGVKDANTSAGIP